MIEDEGLTCTVGVTGVEVQGKFMGDLRARMKMRFLPHDHVRTKKKGSMVYGIYQASYRSYSVLSTCTHAHRGRIHKAGSQAASSLLPPNQNPETENTSTGGEESAHLPVRGHLGPKSKCWKQLVPVGRQ